MKADELRQSFIDFFVKKNKHTHISSSPVIPAEDPTLLFTNAGMNQFKDVLLGKEKRFYTKACSVQKCIRAGGKHNDLDEVGKDGRHLTFFEMLGNWSFEGSYYKEEAIEWAWQFSKKILKFPVENLYVSIYKDDEESYKIWRKHLRPEALDDSRIIRLGNLQKGDEENFWSMGPTGPCGYCTELYYDQGKEFGCGKPDCQPGCSCDRFLEYWNLVFMEFNRTDDGSFVPLTYKNVDTGMGLERVLALKNGVQSVFDTDLFIPLRDKLNELSQTQEHVVAKNVIADHIRSISFSLADGALFSNEGRGYVLRRILRRALRFAHDIGFKEPVMYKLVDSLCTIMGSFYPELVAKKDYIQSLIKDEEEKFLVTIDRGIELFNQEVQNIIQKKQKKMSGSIAFKLYDTYGFPVDLTKIMLAEKGFGLDNSEYERLMSNQRERSQKSAQFIDKNIQLDWVILNNDSPVFVGYSKYSLPSTINRYAQKDNYIYVVLTKTPFYAESGGQVGDTGIIEHRDFTLKVLDTQKIDGFVTAICKLEKGACYISKDTEVQASIINTIRDDTRRNHTSTHLLHRALKDVLGRNVNQAGSKVEAEKLRFDYNYSQKPTLEEIEAIEDKVYEKILENIPVETDVDIPLEEAKKQGAISLFGEKYSDKVRVVKISDYSMELCGGTHVTRTGDIGSFKIISESSVGAGLRRIEAITGFSVPKYDRENKKVFILELEKLKEEMKLRETEFKKSKRNEITSSLEKYIVAQEKIKDAHLVFFKVNIDDREDLLHMSDLVKEKYNPGICVIFSEGEKTHVIVTSTIDAIKAHEFINSLLSPFGGKGGGKPHLAQGSIGKDIEYKSVINTAKQIIHSLF